MPQDHGQNGVSERPFRLDGRIALITGSTRGIGAAIARDFSEAGAQVLITGRKQSEADAMAAKIVAAGGDALGFGYDAQAQGAVTQLVKSIVEKVGRLDILVNNAAILKPHVIAKLTESEFDLLFQVNVKSALFLTQSLLELLQQSKSAAVINMAAAGAHAPMVGIGAYCATKAALVNLTRTLAKEWARKGIRVNAVTPGSTATDMILPTDEVRRQEFIADMASQNLLNRLAEPIEIARAVRFLASEAASFITGHILVVDGGLLA